MSNHSDTRADMLTIIESENVLIDGITFLNSPKYHVNLKDCHNVTVRNFVIEVDVFRQKKYLTDAGFMDRYGIPTFPLNTDGIDPSASSVHIRWDDNWLGAPQWKCELRQGRHLQKHQHEAASERLGLQPKLMLVMLLTILIYYILYISLLRRHIYQV
jgi:hypothetical protein